MAKTFNVTADCKPDEHYMVDLKQRVSKIKEMIDAGKYFTINRAKLSVMQNLKMKILFRLQKLLYDFKSRSSLYYGQFTDEFPAAITKV